MQQIQLCLCYTSAFVKFISVFITDSLTQTVCALSLDFVWDTDGQSEPSKTLQCCLVSGPIHSVEHFQGPLFIWLHSSFNQFWPESLSAAAEKTPDLFQFTVIDATVLMGTLNTLEMDLYLCSVLSIMVLSLHKVWIMGPYIHKWVSLQTKAKRMLLTTVWSHSKGCE